MPLFLNTPKKIRSLSAWSSILKAVCRRLRKKLPSARCVTQKLPLWGSWQGEALTDEGRFPFPDGEGYGIDCVFYDIFLIIIFTKFRVIFMKKE